MKVLIRGGRVIDPVNNTDKICDLLVGNGKILRAGDFSGETAEKEIIAEGKIVSPGFVDMHTHLREPGREDKEDIRTGLKAALAGGFTCVNAMPNTEPPCDSRANAEYLRSRARDEGLARLLPVGAITRERAGREMAEMGELKAGGCLSVSDDGTSVPDPAVMRRAMEYAAMLDLLVIAHCEDASLAGEGVMHEGYWSTVLGLAPIPAESESVMVKRDIELAELTGARLHIAHISTEQSIAAVREAKKRGVKVTAEVTPHHFSLTDEAIQSFDTNLKVNPPLRASKDVEAIKEAIADGTIDVIATDHAPHLESEKEQEFDYAPFGMIGLETAMSLAVQNLVDTGIITLSRMVQMLSVSPALLLGLDAGTLSEGAEADITVFDPDRTWVYEKENIVSKASNSPFVGQELKGKVSEVLVSGSLMVENGVLLEKRIK